MVQHYEFVETVQLFLIIVLTLVICSIWPLYLTECAIYTTDTTSELRQMM